MMFEHKSVLLYETIDSLNVKPDGIYVMERLGAADMLWKYADASGNTED